MYSRRNPGRIVGGLQKRVRIGTTTSQMIVGRPTCAHLMPFDGAFITFDGGAGRRSPRCPPIAPSLQNLVAGSDSGQVFTKRNRDFFHKCRSHAAFVKTHRFSVSTFSMSSYMYMTNVDTRDSNLQTRRRPVASFAQSGTPPWLNERTPTRRPHWQKIMPESSIAAQILIARNVHRRPISLCKYSA